ncbi:nuclear transport factor 2 family protein [Haloferax denitrificans]|uniref:nuclear transport factor 2 family protein n=1 Tax=Haloferax denitrificans TaxID=35745 RepID=UPI003C7020CC
MDSPRDIVEEFFDRMEDDRRNTVGDLFAEDAVISLPGATFEGPTAAYDFLAHLEPRYEWAAKEFDRWLEAGDTVVSVGSLYGVDSDGADFSDVRYVDIYVVRRGLIERLDIWNDLAVDGVVPVPADDAPAVPAEE